MALSIPETTIGPPATTSGNTKMLVVPPPERLPFPTHPALPDRRARLKRLNLSLLSGSDSGEAENESSRGPEPSKRASIEELGKDEIEKIESLINVGMNGEALYPDSLLTYRSRLEAAKKKRLARSQQLREEDLLTSRRQIQYREPEIRIRPVTPQDGDGWASSRNSALRSSRRNIVTARQKARREESASTTSRSGYHTKHSTDISSSVDTLRSQSRSRTPGHSNRLHQPDRPLYRSKTPTGSMGIGSHGALHRSSQPDTGRSLYRSKTPTDNYTNNYNDDALYWSSKPGRPVSRSRIPQYQGHNKSDRSSHVDRPPSRSRTPHGQGHDASTSSSQPGRPLSRSRTPRDRNSSRTIPQDPGIKSSYKTTERLKLPDIHAGRRSRPESPQGFFLTALSGYDESPAPTERQASSSSKSPRAPSNSTPPPASENNIEPEATSLPVPNEVKDVSISHERLPVLVTSRENETRLVQHHSGALQRVYLEGLDCMRSHVQQVEEEAEKINRAFHKVETTNGEDYFLYLKECDERLLQANNELRKRDVKLEVLDSDTRLVRLLNQLRKDKQPDKPLVDFITNFWNELKETTDQLKALLDKFNNSVLLRLSNNYIGGHNADLQVPVCQQYALDIENFLKDLDTQLGYARLVVSSYGNGLHRDLMDNSQFSERLMVLCDLKAFPLLGYVNDVCAKVLRMCEAARLWLARDEQFMHEINSFIRETRTAARQREQILLTEKQKRKKQEKNLKIAHSILHSNREKLRQIETDLKDLEAEMNHSKEAQKVKVEEMHQKETEVDFLKLTLQHTKKNYSLHSKRGKLLKQVKELEGYLRSMESNLEVVQDQILAKSHQRILLTEKINHSEKSYDALKTDYERFSENLEELEAEVSGLSGQLLQLEVVHTIKTSPESLDNLMDRPSTVKLSQSLKERIRERKKKAAAVAKVS